MVFWDPDYAQISSTLPFSYVTNTEFFSIIAQGRGLVCINGTEMDIASQSKTVEEAVANLKEAVELYLEDEDIQMS